MRSTQYSAMSPFGVAGSGIGPPSQQPLLVSPKVMKPFVDALNSVYVVPKKLNEKPIGNGDETTSSPLTAMVVGVGRKANVPAVALPPTSGSPSSCREFGTVGQLSAPSGTPSPSWSSTPLSVPGAAESVPGAAESVPGAAASVPGALASVPGAMASLPGAVASLPGAAASLPGIAASLSGDASLPGAASDPVAESLPFFPHDEHPPPKAPITHKTATA